MIPVTKPFLPPKEEYQKYLDGIWERNWLTNNGPLVNELELRLKEHLGLDHMRFIVMGTLHLLCIPLKLVCFAFRVNDIIERRGNYR